MREYKVRALFNSKPTEIVIKATSSSNALIIAKKMYPNGKILNAKPY